ncbi:hypothetical protein XENTR_v10014167 [Xenopus tropicalis]|nr:hypothetical protein XENTR_v10014167 [Xenopus tropicalis]
MLLHQLSLAVTRYLSIAVSHLYSSLTRFLEGNGHYTSWSGNLSSCFRNPLIFSKLLPSSIGSGGIKQQNHAVCPFLLLQFAASEWYPTKTDSALMFTDVHLKYCMSHTTLLMSPLYVALLLS